MNLMHDKAKRAPCVEIDHLNATLVEDSSCSADKEAARLWNDLHDTFWICAGQWDCLHTRNNRIHIDKLAIGGVHHSEHRGRNKPTADVLVSASDLHEHTTGVHGHSAQVGNTVRVSEGTKIGGIGTRARCQVQAEQMRRSTAT